MSRRLASAFYLSFWAAFAALAVYLVDSFWLGAGLAYALFFLVTATLAHVHRSREARARGEQPPPFMAFLFSPGAKGFKSDVAVPRPLRLMLGALVLVGGAAFAVLGALFLATVDFSTVPSPLGARVMLAVFCALGLGFCYVGFRLLVLKNHERLFSRR